MIFTSDLDCLLSQCGRTKNGFLGLPYRNGFLNE